MIFKEICYKFEKFNSDNDSLTKYFSELGENYDAKIIPPKSIVTTNAFLT